MKFFIKTLLKYLERVFQGAFALTLCFLPVSHILASGQIIAAEYYVNTDPGKGNGTSVSVPDDGTFNESLESITFELPANSYSEGYHTIYVRFKEANGKWGAPKGMVFKVGLEKEFIHEIKAAEYFVDNDPGKGMGTPITVTEDGAFDNAVESIEIDISGGAYSEGQHMVYVRFKDANEQWGAPKGQVFSVRENADFTYSISKAEYFIDTDPGKGNGTSIVTAVDGTFDGNTESFEMDVQLSNLSDGLHMIYTRFQDNTGNWGAEKGFQFQVKSTEDEDLYIETAEYFVNEDPGAGSGTSIAAPADGTFDEPIEELEATFTISDLPIGRHFVYFRVKGSNGKWGPARGVPFQVENITVVEKAEYYFNSDPGEGNGTAITASKDGSFNSTEEEVQLDIPVSETGLGVGQHTMYLRFRNSKGEWSQPSSKTFSIQTKPVIAVSTDTLIFGEHVVGDSLAQTFTIKNNGDGALNITNITSSSSEFNVSQTSGSIPANSSNELTFTVNYEPTSAGDKNATLTIANNDQNKTIKLLGSALAKAPIMEVSSSSLDYGTVIVGDSVARYVAIYNTGYDTLKLANISVNSEEFRVSPTSGVLAPGFALTDSLVINVALVPGTEGNKNASLNLSGNVSTQQVSLSGIAELNPEPTIALSTDSLSFGAVEIGKDSARSFQIRNLGTNALTVSTVSMSGEAFSAEISAPVDIERGSPLTVPVIFAPGTVSGFSGYIEITSNDVAKNKTRVVFSGEGTLGPPTRLLSINPDTLNFGLVTQSTTSKQVLTLSNDGNATLKITVIGSDNNNFYVENAPSPSDPLFISPESSQDVEITFAPDNGGGEEFAGKLNISSDRTNSSAAEQVVLKGIGVDEPAPSIQMSTQKLNFGEVRIENSSSLSFSVTNGGNADLIVNNLTTDNSAFKIDSPTNFPFTLQPSQQQSIVVEFDPVNPQVYSAQLTLQSNIDPAKIDLSGKGVALSTGVDSTEIKSGTNSVVSGQSVPINITPTGLGDSGAAYVYYKSGGGAGKSSYTKTQLQNSGSGVYSVSLPANIVSVNGISYWFEVTDGSEVSTSPAKDPHLNPYTIIVETPSGIVKSSPQPAGTEQNLYRMISIPLTGISGAVDTVMKNFGAGSEDTWRLFRWQSGSYIEHTASNFESFAPGRGYWFITTKAASIKTGSGKSARTDEMFSIFLQPGWNMIGSPFAYTTSWDNAEKPESVENLWHYDGTGFTNSPTMKPWEGYFVNNSSNNPVELKLNPAQEASGSTKQIGGNYLTFDDSQGWSIHVNASSGMVADRYNYLGVQQEALDGLDSFDLKDAPKQPGEFLQLAFHDEKISAEKLAVDFRSHTSEGHYWDFEVHTNSSSPEINMDFSPLGEFPGEFQVRLIDINQSTIWNLNIEEENSRSIRSALGDTLTRKFRLLAGTEAFIKSNNMGISELPASFVLKHNYPNPFNPSTTIVFGLPESAEVTLEVFDALGRKVSTLINKKMEAGYYDLIWNAASMASGVYFYRLSARGSTSKSTYTKIQKMTLIK
ncbi:MAG: choice-of-anchor D domain-containing protein [Balneolaceae bacterium]